MSADLKIYVAENDPGLLKNNILYLTNNGYTDVTGFIDGLATLEKLNRNPDVILLGSGLENPGTAEILETIKRYDPQIFVVFINSKRQFKLAVQMLKLGQFNSLLKRAASLVNERTDYLTLKRQLLYSVVPVKSR